jgi:hypothetical protein
MIESADKYLKETAEFIRTATWGDYGRYTYPRDLEKQVFVSTHGGKVIGVIAIYINKAVNAVLDITIAGSGVEFGRDVVLFIRYLGDTYRKVNSTVIVGCPHEKTYDRIYKRYGGYVVGIRRREVLLDNGEYGDLKIYEYVNPAYGDAGGIKTKGENYGG